MVEEHLFWGQNAQVEILPLPGTNWDFEKVIQLLYTSVSSLVKWK